MEMINKSLIPELQTIVNSTDLGKEVFTVLSTRERSAARSDIDAIFRELEAKSKKELNYFKYLEVWKLLEEKQVGTLVYGRKGNPNRFVWRTNFRHVGRLGLGLQPEVWVETKKDKEPKIEAPKAPSTITFVIPDSVSKEDIMALLNLGAQLAKENKK